MMRTCTIVGTGLSARALGPALRAAQVRIANVAGRDPMRAAMLAQELGATTSTIASADLTSDLILLCVPESAITEVCLTVFNGRDARGSIAAHLAGSMGPAALEPARDAGALLGKLHPIASLSGGSKRLEGAAWGYDGDGPARVALSDLIRRLGGRPIDLAGVDLPLYHLAAVIASNYLLVLAEAATQLWTMSGAPGNPVDALAPLMAGTVENWRDLDLEDAITGPISRGDSKTVEQQLRAITDSARSLAPMYRALGELTLEIVERRGSGDQQGLAEIGRLLSDPTVLH
jgi:predicted short-subunit dehydrogenase-like oxidoreductase (DUF2520 family)